MKIYLPMLFLILTMPAMGQERPIKVVTEEIPNRLAFYAINENDQDFDVTITITGNNFRQSRARPRPIRVPATSKVHLKTIVLVRGKKPSYSYELEINDSLSNRALKKEFEKVKIKPKKPIIVYLPKNCTSCDSLINPLQNGKYHFSQHNLEARPDMQSQLQGALGSTNPIDSLTTPILNIGGKLFTQITSYEALLEVLEKD
ncbi:hypothetical protein ACEZ3G_10290 [Maribacter algicola]|uniref:Uncharacterized protein n=1 Tax=Meishania litoralis TaxID=3434685 RepID=A0ACC7LLE6_9FLAO